MTITDNQSGSKKTGKSCVKTSFQVFIYLLVQGLLILIQLQIIKKDYTVYTERKYTLKKKM